MRIKSCCKEQRAGLLKRNAYPILDNIPVDDINACSLRPDTATG